MKTFLILALYLSVLFSSDTGYSLDTSSVKFMPLSVGNIWVYDHYYQGTYQNSTVTRVTGDTIVNSKRYYKCVGQYFNGWYRTDTITGSLMFLGGPNNCNHYFQETLVDSFAISSGCYGCGSPFCAERDSNRTILGLNVPVFFTGYWTGNSAYNMGYAKYIGVYTSTSFLLNIPTHTYTLRGARINGVLYGDTSGITGITPVSSEIPDKFEIVQNYPNPFNPQTKIKFAVPKVSFTKLIVYDLLGREVTTLVDEELKPGTYEADWDASDFSSGVYFYKIITDSFIETKKMVLMK